MKIELNLEVIKHQATTLKNYLKEGGHTISHSSCLNVVSKMYGVENYNTLKALLEK